MCIKMAFNMQSRPTLVQRDWRPCEGINLWHLYLPTSYFIKRKYLELIWSSGSRVVTDALLNYFLSSLVRLEAGASLQLLPDSLGFTLAFHLGRQLLQVLQLQFNLGRVTPQHYRLRKR